MSLSARRAWIEITVGGVLDTLVTVALRKESVDRNKRAEPSGQAQSVALRKESVDRNTLPENPMIGIDGRSPQGERG